MITPAMEEECRRLCGDAGRLRGMHTTAPVMCPVQLALWKNPKLAPQRQPIGVRKQERRPDELRHAS